MKTSISTAPSNIAEVLAQARIHKLTLGSSQGIREIWPNEHDEYYDFLSSIEGLVEVTLNGTKRFRFRRMASICRTVTDLELHFVPHLGIDSERLDCRVLGQFPSIATLMMHFRQSGSLEHFEDLPPSITALGIFSPHFSHYSQWPQLPSLKTLDLRGYPNQTFASLDRYTTLEELRIDSGDLRDVAGIERLTSLRTVDVAECEELEDISAFVKLPQLNKLRVCGCHQRINLSRRKFASDSVVLEDKRSGELMSAEDIDDSVLVGGPIEVIFGDEWEPFEPPVEEFELPQNYDYDKPADPSERD